MRRLVLSCIASMLLVGPSAAVDAPAFLKGKRFATDAEVCKVTQEGDELQMDQFGISGHEFSCRFLDFLGEVDVESGDSFVYVSRVNCGDDSGINRPDLLTLIPQPDGAYVTVQSQNEYQLTETEIRTAMLVEKFDPDNPPDASFVSRDYKLCK